MTLKVEKRSGEVQEFSIEKIKLAMVKASREAGLNSLVVDNEIEGLSKEIESSLNKHFGSDIISVEDVHNSVEEHLMRAELFSVAKSYIIHRAEKEKERRASTNLKKLLVTKSNGTTVHFNPPRLRRKISQLAQGLEYVSSELIYEETVKNLYSGISTKDLSELLLLAALSLFERDPEYDTFCNNLVCELMRKEVLGYGEYDEDSYKDGFEKYIRRAVKLGLLDERALGFDLKRLGEAVCPELDKLFPYIGLKTLKERYLISHNKRLLELPQYFWMRVAIGLSLLEKEKEKWAIEFYNEMSSHRIIPSTPTLLHSCLPRPQLSSCYGLTVQDDLHNIFKTYSDCAQLGKYSGGIGVDFTNVRATLATVNSTKIESQGIIPFIKILDSTTVAINRSGKRRGATCVYIEPWHLDVEDFIDLKRNTGDDRRRTHDLNTALWIPDLLYKRVENKEDWTLFSPDETPDLHGLYAEEFEKRYKEYEELAENGKIKLFKKINALSLYKKIIASQFSTGHPFQTNKDSANIRNSQKHVGVINSTQLCCVAGDQRVPTERGILTAKELYELGGENTVVGKDKLEKASVMVRPKQNTELVKIITKQGYEHKVTPDHKVWVHNYGYKEAKDLIKGDRLSLQSYEGVWGELNLQDEAFIMGLIAGDGTYGLNAVCVDIWNQKAGFSEEFLLEVKLCIHRLINKYKNIVAIDSRSSLEPKYSVNKKGTRYRISSVALNQILTHLGFNKQNKTAVPKIVWNGTRETVSKYLEGLYWCDSTVQGTAGKNGVTTCSICSINISLIKELQILLLNFGIKSVISRQKKSGFCMMPDGSGGKKDFHCQDSYRLIVTSVEGCRILEKLTKIGQYRNNAQYLTNLNKDGYPQKFYAVFDKLENLTNEDVYCLQVYNDDHLWSCNGFITKNTEIFEVNNEYEHFVCNLNSQNLKKFITPKTEKHKPSINWDLLEKSTKIQVRMLDNVIDICYYPTPEAKNSNLKHRPVGLGLMGTQDLLFALNINFEDAEDIIDQLQEFISYHAILSSCELASEKGIYSSFEGSEWSQGNVPIDTYKKMCGRPHIIPLEVKERMNWDYARMKVKDGIRNSNIMATAPTATIANLIGCYPSIEPQYSNIYVKSNMSGEFTIVNKYLVNDLKSLNLWNSDILNKLKYYDGDLSKIDEIPETLRIKYRGAFDIDQKALLKLTAIRQKWIDQGQSHNIFYKGASGKEIADIYMYAWKLGLKSTYYLRTLKDSKINDVTVKACSITDPSCEACQ